MDEKPIIKSDRALIERIEELVKENELLKYKLVMMDKALEEAKQPTEVVGIVSSMYEPIVARTIVSAPQLYMMKSHHQVYDQLKHTLVKGLVDNMHAARLIHFTTELDHKTTDTIASARIVVVRPK